MSRKADWAMVTSGELPKPLTRLSANVPSLIVVVPVYELFRVSVNLPAPSFTRLKLLPVPSGMPVAALVMLLCASSGPKLTEGAKSALLLMTRVPVVPLLPLVGSSFVVCVKWMSLFDDSVHSGR